MSAARLAPVELPDFGVPERMPELPAGALRGAPASGRGSGWRSAASTCSSSTRTASTARTSRTSRASTRASRRPCSSSVPTGEPAILVGNECFGMAGAAPLPMRRHLFQDLSLTDQPRDRSRPLETILGEEGVASGVRVGVAGWKSYARRDWLEVPAYLVDTLRELVGRDGARRERQRPLHRRRQTACGPPTRSSSSSRSSTPPATRPRA